MVYSSRLRSGIGAVSSCFNILGLRVQDSRFLEHGKHEPSEDAPLVLVACSGGRDSLALVALSVKVCSSRGLRCAVVIVDHHLQEHSSEVANQAALRCENLGIESNLIHVVSISVTDSGTGVEAAARDARYSAIIDVARKINAYAVLLAHTANDQAESVLIGLRDSAGLDAVAGMKNIVFRDGVRFARPIIELSREDTTGICKDLGIDWWDDPTNGDLVSSDSLSDEYPLRSRVRHNLMPYISKFFNANMVQVLARGARLAQDDLDYINICVDEVVDRVVTVRNSSDMKEATPAALSATIDAKTLAKNHAAIRRRVVARALAELNLRFSARHVEAIDSLISDWHGQKPITLPNCYLAERKSNTVTISTVLR